jgi:hypothetical protein
MRRLEQPQSCSNGSRRRNTQLPTNGANERFRYFSVPRYGRTLPCLRVFVDAMTAPFARQTAAIRFQMTD